MRNIPKDSKIAVAMSGGVDSSVTAALLVEKGYDVRGIFMEHLDGMEDQKKSVRKTAKKLGIELEVVDYRKKFKETVIDYFLDEYRKGRTPNPCVVCNKWIKFGELLDRVLELGCDYLATGHYARLQREITNYKLQISNEGEERKYSNKDLQSKNFGSDQEEDTQTGAVYKLLMAVDKKKDQSYFLWQLTQRQLEHILLPIGNLRKSSIVNIAGDYNLPAVRRKESYEVCFVKKSLEKFLRDNIPNFIEPGPVLNVKGEVIGNHNGLPLYTYGQRRGFEVTKYQGIPQYVVGIDKEKNALIVGRGLSAEVKKFRVEDTNWLAPNFKLRIKNYKLKRKKEFNCKVRVRHLGELMNCVVNKDNRSNAEVILGEQARAITPGQSAVFYRGGEVLGGGVISGFAPLT